MKDSRNLFIEQLVILLRLKLNIYIKSINGLHNFLNEVLIIPFTEILEENDHKLSLENAFNWKHDLEKNLSCSLFRVELCMFGLNESMYPELFVTVHPNFVNLKEDSIELFWMNFDDGRFNLIECREAEGVSLNVNDDLWNKLITEVKSEITFGTLKSLS